MKYDCTIGYRRLNVKEIKAHTNVSHSRIIATGTRGAFENTEKFNSKTKLYDTLKHMTKGKELIEQNPFFVPGNFDGDTTGI